MAQGTVLQMYGLNIFNRRQIVNYEENVMNGSTFAMRVIPIAAIVAMGLYASTSMAGATNRGDNTSATPGEKSSTVTTPADPATERKDMRRGTTRPGEEGNQYESSGSSEGTGSTGTSSGNTSGDTSGSGDTNRPR